MMIRRTCAGLLISLAATGTAFAGSGAFNGWRGNGTGIWPDAKPPLIWSRTPLGVIGAMRVRADRPTADEKPASDALPLEKGIVPVWLVLGPFPVKHSIDDFGKPQLADETSVRPSAGDTAGERTWKKMAGRLDDRFAFGPANIPWTDLGEAIGGVKANQVGYAHTYLWSSKGGTVRALVDHTFGMKAWLNGNVVYAAPERRVALGSYYGPSKVEFGEWSVSPSANFELPLQPGWNRLLVKLSSFIRDDQGWNQQNFCLRLMDLPSIAHENKNIVWMTELPHRSNATPIVAGDRLFVMAEPDELVCLDKRTGKILWTAANNYYELLTPAEKQANPAFKEKVDPLLTALRKEPDFVKRLGLHSSVQKTLTDIDDDRFAWKADGHFQAHFGIVGFTTPTPVSDGKHVWVWCGNAVAACYDLNGQRQWIQRVEARELTYSSSPALADGIFAVFQQHLIGLDATTGKIRWHQKKVDLNNGAILAARIADVDVFVSSLGHIVRAVDGKLLYREPERAGGASSWAPPVILGNVVYLPRYGIKQLLVLDCTDAAGDTWGPQRSSIGVPDGTGRLPNGKLVDRPTCGSPLVVDDLAYMVDIYSTLYVFDIKAKKMLYLHDTELNGLFHYNAVPVAASPTLIGKHIVIQDNQGVALVLEPGRNFRQVGRNHLATQLDRYWPIPSQETIGYSPPVSDGNRIFVRGERYLYCIGER